MSHSLLTECFRAAVRACDPRARTAAAVRALDLSSAPFVISVGKAAPGMAEGASDGLTGLGLTAVGGLIVSETGEPARVAGWRHLKGDHPVPGPASLAAANALSVACEQARLCGDVIVLVSGGTSSLVAAPIPELGHEDLVVVVDKLLASGAPINVVNLIRRRLLRWAAGRLTAALSPARVHCLIVSDVVGSDVASIGSGPCVPDPSTVEDIRRALGDWSITGLSASVMAVLGEAGRLTSIGPASVRVLLDNATAVAIVLEELQLAGIHVHPCQVLAGEASCAGRDFARMAISLGHGALVAGGETTVTLGAARASGGRCQEFALAAARELRGHEVTMLVAGTDGRDGPTDAAGAVVDGSTWDAIVAAGRDPDADLAAHASYAALDSAGALLRTGPTGTNVNDLAIALTGPTGAPRRSPTAGP